MPSAIADFGIFGNARKNELSAAIFLQDHLPGDASMLCSVARGVPSCATGRHFVASRFGSTW